MTSAHNEDGFTLIEGLVSLVILSAVIIASLNILTTSLAAIRRVEQRQAVMRAAGQVVAELKLRQFLTERDITGKTAGQRWTVRVSLLFPRGVAPEMSIRPFRVIATGEGDPAGQPDLLYDTVILAVEGP